jgi:RimJ/RimL family protein N-acetyltransferase
LCADLEFRVVLRDSATLAEQLAWERQRLQELFAAGAWTYCLENALCVVRALPWDSTHFGWSCADLFRVYALPTANAATWAELIDGALGRARQRQIDFLSARIAAAQVPALQQLVRVGFAPVDTSIELAARLPFAGPAEKDVGSDLLQLRRATAADVPRLQTIAETFSHNRFRLDPQIPTALAAGVHRAWVARAALGGEQGENLLVAEWDDQVVGFGTFVQPSTLYPQIGTFKLIVIDPAFRGRGFSLQIVRACCHQLSAQWVVTSTQASNVSMQRAFAHLGFRPIGARHILHWHRASLG